MAIAFDVSGNSTGSASPNSFTLTPNSVTNNIVIASVNVPNGATNVAATYGGVAMTQIGLATGNIGNSQNYAFYIVGTAAGAQSVSCSWTGAGNGQVGAANYTGVRQTTPVPDNADVTGATGSTWAPSLTTTVDNSWVILCFTNSSGAITAGANTVLRVGSVSNGLLADSNAVISPAGSRTLNVSSSSSSGNYGGEIFSIAPFIAVAGSASANVPMLSLLGVGL